MLSSVVVVSWTLLAPAVAVVATLVALAWSMHRVETEVAALRVALRRSRAANVAVHELERDAATTIAEAHRIEQTARTRAHLRRVRRRSEPR